jgi:hypothetical protein
MGARTRRRLIGGLIAACAIVVVIIAAASLTGRSTSHSAAGPRVGGHIVGKNDAQYYKNSFKLVFGMTKAQAQRLVGMPSKKLGRCWQYDINVEYPANSRRAAVIWNADRVCFDGGVYSDSHGEMNGTWDYQRSLPRLG